MIPRLDLMLAIQGARAQGFNHYAHALEQLLRKQLAAEGKPVAGEPAHLTRRRQAWRASRRSLDSRAPFASAH